MSQVSARALGLDGEATPTPREGDIVADRYRVGRVLGSGGMGIVVAATEVGTGEEVALKLLHPHADRQTVERFLREARAVARLENEHVVRVFDVGRLPNGRPFLLMEHLQGETLRARIARVGPLPLEHVIPWSLEVCQALSAAHAEGIVHRDIKPANLFLVENAAGLERIKVLDFGVAKFEVDGQDPGLTTSGNVVGSPSFASPEQLLRPRDVDTRADLWGLGVTLYQALSAELPFRSDNPVETYMLVLSSTPVPLRERRPDLPPALAEAVTRCLEKEPSRRVQRAEDLAVMLRACVRERGASPDAVAGPESTVHDGHLPIEVPPAGDAKRESGIHRRGVILAGLAATVVLAGATTAAFVRSSRAPSPTPEPSGPMPVASASTTREDAAPAEPSAEANAATETVAKPTSAPQHRATVPRPRPATPRDPRSYR